MFRRTFWVAAGVALGVFVVIKGRQYLRKLTPAGIQEQIVSTAAQASERVRDFIEVARTSTAERESELRAALGMTGEADDAPNSPKPRRSQ